MDTIISGLKQGITLFISGDPALWGSSCSLRMSGIALVISGGIGIPTGALIGLIKFLGGE